MTTITDPKPYKPPPQVTHQDVQVIRLALEFAIQDRRAFIDAYDGKDNQFTREASKQILRMQKLYEKFKKQ